MSIFKDAFHNYPTITSYVVVLSGLSVLPVVSFLGFSVFVISILFGLGLLFTATWSVVILGAAGVALFSLLGFLAVLSFWIVLGSFFTFLSVKLALNLSRFLLNKLKANSFVQELLVDKSQAEPGDPKAQSQNSPQEPVDRQSQIQKKEAQKPDQNWLNGQL